MIRTRSKISKNSQKISYFERSGNFANFSWVFFFFFPPVKSQGILKLELSCYSGQSSWSIFLYHSHGIVLPPEKKVSTQVSENLTVQRSKIKYLFKQLLRSKLLEIQICSHGSQGILSLQTQTCSVEGLSFKWRQTDVEPSCTQFVFKELVNLDHFGEEFTGF